MARLAVDVGAVWQCAIRSSAGGVSELVQLIWSTVHFLIDPVHGRQYIVDIGNGVTHMTFLTSLYTLAAYAFVGAVIIGIVVDVINRSTER